MESPSADVLFFASSNPMPGKSGSTTTLLWNSWPSLSGLGASAGAPGGNWMQEIVAQLGWSQGIMGMWIRDFSWGAPKLLIQNRK